MEPVKVAAIWLLAIEIYEDWSDREYDLKHSFSKTSKMFSFS